MTEVSFTAEGRIAHFLSPQSDELGSVLSHVLSLSPPRAKELLALGAVYGNRARLNENSILTKGDYLRVHLQPRRFPRPQTLRIVALTPEFVIVDKPCGLPVPPTVDNTRENLWALLQEQLGGPLFVTHRLDVPTSGLVLLARTPEFQSQFNRWLIRRKVEKWYRAVVAKPVALGKLLHYQKPDRFAPKVVSTEAFEGWLRCEMTVLTCEPCERGFELTLRVETGRTHQIRCQLAAIGNPILGDTLYDGTRGLPDAIALQACALFLPVRGLAWRLPN